MERIQSLVEFLYPQNSQSVLDEITKLSSKFQKDFPQPAESKPYFSEKDAVLITYADHVKREGDTLPILKEFLDSYTKKYINRVHILPFYPYSSDDGFSVIDYYQVKEDFGVWDDVENISKDYTLMFDLVMNHCSAKSKWFEEFLKGNPEYENYFIWFDNDKVDLSKVFRPRTSPLLTPFETAKGTRYVWTTFSADQIDLNFAEPKVFLEILKIILFYISKGAKILRIDAITYVWKEVVTNCVHLPKTHALGKLIRAILDEIAPDVWIITETNVPHKDNISYFGNGMDEAHLVYNFALPPLLLYTFFKEDSSTLTRWAKSLEYPSDKTTFFNFTASHDGIGVTQLYSFSDEYKTLTYDDVGALVEDIKNKGGKVNYRTISENEQRPYELNAVYLSAVGSVDKFIASQAIELSLKGVPAIYFNSVIGAENWEEGVEKLGYNRAINRRKFDLDELKAEIAKSGSVKNEVYSRYTKLLETRINQKAFSPHADQEILDLGPGFFGLVRSNNNEKILCLYNISSEKAQLNAQNFSGTYTDLLTNETIDLSKDLSFGPHQFYWLKANG